MELAEFEIDPHQRRVSISLLRQPVGNSRRTAYDRLLTILLVRLWRRAAPLYLLPLAMAAADVLENLTLAALALGHAGAPSPPRHTEKSRRNIVRAEFF